MPEIQQVITGQLCSKLKKDYDGYILKYKIRQVTYGFEREESINFVGTFAILVKLISYKFLFGVNINSEYKI